MSQVSHELLLAFAYVARISDPETLRTRFFESISEIVPSFAFDYSAEEPPASLGLEAIPIATIHSSFGFAVRPPLAAGDPLPAEETSLIRNAFQFLAELLENRVQAQRLKYEVDARTERIIEQEERYKDIFENKHVVMLIVDPEDGRIVDANPAAAEFYGMPRSRLQSISVYDLNDQDTSLVKDRLHLATKREVQYFGARHRLADGSVRDVEVYTGPAVSEGVLRLFSIIHDVTVRVRAEAELRKSLEEKDILLKELHHRVKNNLQIISSMLNLQMGSNPEPLIEAEFVKAQNRIYTLSLLHESLYQSERFDRLDLGTYLEAIVSAVVSSCQVTVEGFDYSVHIEPMVVDIDIAIPCGLIVNELVTNVVKHAFTGSSGRFELRVDRLEGRRIALLVNDTGRGSHEGESRGKGIGLKLVEALVSQLAGTISVDRTDGTNVEIVFPERTAARS